MFEITKQEPEFYKIAKRKSNNYSDKAISDIRPKLRKHILEKEQDCLCAYCEKKINFSNLKSNIDHFKKRDLFPELQLEYENYLVSCNTINRCSSHKDSQRGFSKDDYANIINPVEENTETYFNYLTTGDIYTNNKKGEYTKDIFNLNQIGLVKAREKLTEVIIQCKNEYEFEELYSFIGEYKSFVKYVYNNY